eukprot:TRINITY_DN7679_c0_g1_i5.p1 TRINITY_DN7679_c0_g1~~TRINITY_DN7679_c0_g1_i5.p1  ORF type:complete len:468 (+),score=109.60 TRINITY_DN7679_c0_g1_i5:155-1558(+)
MCIRDRSTGEHTLMQGPSVSVNGEPIDAELLRECRTAGQARLVLAEHFDLDSPRIIYKRRTLLDPQELPATGKLFVIGAPTQAVQQLADEDELLTQRREQVALSRAKLRQAAKRKARGSVQSPYGFLSFNTLPGFENAAVAKDFLKRLAADRGIAGVMKKHCWTVPRLSEMYPDGKVGEDPVCVMGLNKNQGQEISLRLRTDDLKGFQRYDDVKKVLYHELAHNVHGDHDNAFSALMSQLIKEGDALDWTQHGGRSTGEDHGWADVLGLGRFHNDAEHEEPAFQGGVGKLGAAPDSQAWNTAHGRPEPPPQRLGPVASGAEAELAMEEEREEEEGSQGVQRGEVGTMMLTQMGFGLPEVRAAAAAGCIGFEQTLSFLLAQQADEQSAQPSEAVSEHEGVGDAAERKHGDDVLGLLMECEGVDMADPEVQQLVSIQQLMSKHRCKNCWAAHPALHRSDRPGSRVLSPR